MKVSEQELLNSYFGTAQDWNKEYWQDSNRAKLYMTAYEDGMDVCDADRYVHLYNLLGRDIGIENFKKLDSYMWNEVGSDILEADKETNNNEWQKIVAFIEKEIM